MILSNFEFKKISVNYQVVRFLKILLLCLFWITYFSTFRYLPGYEWTLEVAVLLSALIVILLILSVKYIVFKRFNLYLLAISVVLPCYTAIVAKSFYGQPILFGLLAQRAAVLSLLPMSVGWLITKRHVSSNELRLSLITLAWVNLILCSLIKIYLDPNQFDNLGAFVSDGGNQFNEFLLPLGFILFGSFYYFSLWVRSNRRIYFFSAFAFIGYIVAANSGRMLIIGLFGALLLVGRLSGPRSGAWISAIGRLILVLSVGGFILLLTSEKIEQMASKFNDAFLALNREEQINDFSANSRVSQFEIIENIILDRFFVGTGWVSNKWNDGFKSIYGYFHPSDLGLIGVVFIYGIVGCLVYCYQYFLGWRCFVKLNKNQFQAGHESITIAFGGYLFYLLITSVTTGAIAFYPEQSLLCIAVIDSQYSGD
jgi:hypothetical protein